MTQSTNTPVKVADKTPKVTPAKETPQQEKNRIMGESRSAANSRLQAAHREEFNALVVEEAKKRGVEWKPQPTKAEKAAQQIEKLIAENPELESVLREKIAGGTKD